MQFMKQNDEGAKELLQHLDTIKAEYRRDSQGLNNQIQIKELE